MRKIARLGVLALVFLARVARLGGERRVDGMDAGGVAHGGSVRCAVAAWGRTRTCEDNGRPTPFRPPRRSARGPRSVPQRNNAGAPAALDDGRKPRRQASFFDQWRMVAAARRRAGWPRPHVPGGVPREGITMLSSLLTRGAGAHARAHAEPARTRGRSLLAASVLLALLLPGHALAQTAKEKELEARVAELERMVQQLVSQQQQVIKMDIN